MSAPFFLKSVSVGRKYDDKKSAQKKIVDGKLCLFFLSAAFPITNKNDIMQLPSTFKSFIYLKNFLQLSRSTLKTKMKPS